MKKLLLVLALVAMASFLFVGCLPTVPVAVTGVTLDQATMTLTAGGATGTLVETVAPADATDKTVTWSSSDEAVATVANGTVTPLTEGTTTITVTAVDGSLTATCEVTVEAAVIPVGPTIAAIPDATVAWDGDGWTYQVVATLGTGTTLTYSLIGNPVLMSISTTGLITWTTILDVLVLEEVTVKVVDNDGLSAEDTFIIEVTEPVPPVVEPLIVTVEYDPSYNDGTTTFVRGADGGCVEVTVTLSEPVEGIAIIWTPEGGSASGLIDLVASDATNMIFEEELCFFELEDCKIVCIEVYKTLEEWCPACEEEELIAIDVITVDSLPPCASFIVSFDVCEMPDCPPFPDPAVFMSWTSICGAECAIPLDCCDDDCSGVGDWSFTLDFFDKLCGSPCDVFEDYGCEIAGEFALGCDCLLCDDPETEGNDEGDHIVEVSIMDNVGNEFTDIWYINFDTDCAITFETDSGIVPTINIDGDYVVDYDCYWDDCIDCGLDLL